MATTKVLFAVWTVKVHGLVYTCGLMNDTDCELSNIKPIGLYKATVVYTCGLMNDTDCEPSNIKPIGLYKATVHIITPSGEGLEVLAMSLLKWVRPPGVNWESPRQTGVVQASTVIRPEQLAEADAFLFGFPFRFGVMSAQCKAFFDSTGELWASQALAGKPAGIFWSTGFHGGGQELTALTAITQLAHHGMLFVPLGYTFGSGMFEMNEVKGGSSYGAGTYAGAGNREPTELELQQAFHQGKYVAEIAKKLKG